MTSASTLPAPLPRPRPRRRWVVVTVVTLAVVLVAVGVASFVTLPYYALVPGQAQSVAPLITVPANRGHILHGQVLLTDVGVANVKAIDWIPDMFDHNTALVHKGDLTGGVPSSQFDAEGVVDMAESQITAGAVALRQLGYSVPERDVGATVYALDPQGPAAHVLHVGDVVTAIDGVATPDPATLVRVLDRHLPGQQVAVTFVTVQDLSARHTVSVTLGSHVVQTHRLPLIGIGDPGTLVPGMGTQPSYAMPFPVSVSADNIGGPSAGLAFTLGIIDSLVGGDLTGGKSVAASGTIRPDGTVGAVGGIAQKTVAVHRAGASVFFVPQANAAEARSHAPAGLTVVGVTSLRQVLAYLRRIGGHLGAAAAGPPPGPGGSSVPTDWQVSPWS